MAGLVSVNPLSVALSGIFSNFLNGLNIPGFNLRDDFFCKCYNYLKSEFLLEKRGNLSSSCLSTRRLQHKIMKIAMAWRNMA